MRLLLPRRSNIESTPWPMPACLLAIGWVAFVSWLALQPSHVAVDDSVAGPVLALCNLVALICAVRTMRRQGVGSPMRRAWTFFAAGYALALLSCFAFAANGEAFPGPGDGLRLAAVPMLLGGLLALPTQRRSYDDRVRLLLDLGVVVTAGFVVLWYFALGPATTDPGLDGWTAIVAVAYPVFDLALVFGAAKALLQQGDASARRPRLILAAGLCALVVGDVFRGRDQLIRGSLAAGDDQRAQWFWLVSALFLLALAAVDESRVPAGRSGQSARIYCARRVSLLPYAAIGVAYLLLLVVAGRHALYPWGGLVMGVVLMTGFVVARQMVELKENHRLAVTDPLTQLAARPKVQQQLATALMTAERTGEPTAVLLIDMNGFKQVNDSLGHEAGDQLLVAFGEMLTRCVSGRDTVGRLGGDEFVVVLPLVGDHRNAVRVAERILTAMTKPLMVGDAAVLPGASIGIAMSDAALAAAAVIDPTSGVADMLRRADRAMYLAKTRAGSAWEIGPTSAITPHPAPLRRVVTAAPVDG